MKHDWLCSWQLIPGGKKQTALLPTQEAACKAMAQVLCDAVDLKKYLQALRKEKGRDCGSSADFLEKFLFDLKLPESADAIPPHSRIPAHCDLSIRSDTGEIRWGYMRGECPTLVAGIDCVDEASPLIVDFSFESPETSDLNHPSAVYIRIAPHISYGTSAYPLMVLLSLQKTPQTQEQIIRRIRRKWDTTIDRKAVGRHLQLLQQMGFPVQHSPQGYDRSGETREPPYGTVFTPNAYPLLICKVLSSKPKSQVAIIEAIDKKYGVKIDRKAVSRHLALLEALGIPVQKCSGGYHWKTV